MIIGSGDIASILNDRPGALFFASGVSNSSLNDWDEFKREMNLLTSQSSKLCCFYFSSISIYTKSNGYTEHKQRMEELVRTKFPCYNIIRIGNIDFGTNPNTFLNFLRGQIDRGQRYTLYDEYKYMISKEQLLLITDNLPLNGQNEINIFGQMAKVKDLI